MPNLKNSIFNRKKLKFLLWRVEQSTISDYSSKIDIINNWIQYIQSGNIFSTKETAIQGKFLDDIFTKVLGYESRIKNTELWNLNQEQLTTIDQKFADGSLGFFNTTSEDVRVVIELKDANTNLDEKQHRYNDTRTPIEQTFSYQHKIGTRCKWIIVSNYKEIRLYHSSSSTEYEVFLIEELSKWEEFRRFYYLLSIDNLIFQSGVSVIDSLYSQNEAEEQNISKEFYSAFKQLRVKLFEHLKQNNSEKPELLLLEKTQKFLDRFIFVSFCEDNRLLPEKAFKNIIEAGKKSYSLSETKIWNELKGLFHAINNGSPPHNINKFNGGLFAEDKDLDSLIIKDDILVSLTKLTEYDFETDVDVNILGHIFEQSISDIEEMKAGIEGKDFDKKTSKRKKEGIYYTPEYITKYIVENAVGGWLEDRRKELGFYELPELSKEDFQAMKSVKGKLLLNENIQKHLEFWQAYKEKLMSIKVLDPACGSGAFLNQAFNYLYAEGQSVNEKIAGLQIGQGELFELDKHILSNNLYGVDLNTESVNITKLSLWIKTANKYSELTALDDNIKCGNSLIDDPEVAGNKAFNWFREFPQVFPGYRVYSKKKTNVKEPDFEYSEQEEEQTPTVQEPSYSYEIESKGFEKHGFDVIIGNPPYVRVTEENDYNYFMNKYQSASNRIDLYALFFEKAMSLLKDKGFISFITPITFLTNLQNRKLRKMILDLAIVKIVDFRFNVFADAKVDTIITVISKNNNTDNKIKVFKIFDFQNPDQFKNVFVEIEQNAIQDIININSNFSVLNLNSKIEQNSIPLEKICKIRNGINPGYPESRKHLLIENPYKGVNPKKRLDAKDIYKYGFEWFNKWIDYDTNFKVDGGSLREESLFIKPKIIIQDIRNLKLHTRLVATFDDNCYYNLYTLHNIQSIDNSVDNKYLLVILNSKLMNFYFAHNYKDIHIKPRYLAILPFKKIGKNHQQSFIALADLMLDKNKELQQIRKAYLEFVKGQFGITKPTTKLQEWYNLSFEEFVKELEKSKVKLTTTQKFDLKPLFDREQEKALEIKAIIETTDKKIDQMVYTLYGLTEEEIRIVEGE